MYPDTYIAFVFKYFFALPIIGAFMLFLSFMVIAALWMIVCSTFGFNGYE